jgi:hypothetical protein
MGDTEVTGQSPADDEQQPPATASQESDPHDAPSAPDVDGAEPVTDPPVRKPDVKYQG